VKDRVGGAIISKTGGRSTTKEPRTATAHGSGSTPTMIIKTAGWSSANAARTPHLKAILSNPAVPPDAPPAAGGGTKVYGETGSVAPAGQDGARAPRPGAQKIRLLSGPELLFSFRRCCRGTVFVRARILAGEGVPELLVHRFHRLTNCAARPRWFSGFEISRWNLSRNGVGSSSAVRRRGALRGRARTRCFERQGAGRRLRQMQRWALADRAQGIIGIGVVTSKWPL